MCLVWSSEEKRGVTRNRCLGCLLFLETFIRVPSLTNICREKLHERPLLSLVFTCGERRAAALHDAYPARLQNLPLPLNAVLYVDQTQQVLLREKRSREMEGDYLMMHGGLNRPCWFVNEMGCEDGDWMGRKRQKGSVSTVCQNVSVSGWAEKRQKKVW